jgi:tetratricopeptide (TPR) repeat protein
LRTAILVTLAAACGAHGGTGPTTPLRAPCAADHYWTGRACAARGVGARELEQGAEALAAFKVDEALPVEQGAEALAAFKVDEALPVLEQARAHGPHLHAVLVRIQEQIGIALAYLGREADALEAFSMLLALEPDHLLSYTLSPKATYLIERARRAADADAREAIDVSWPRELRVARPIPVEVEVLGDPRALLARAELHVRRKGEPGFRIADVTLAPRGRFARIALPPVSGTRPEVLQLWAAAYDRAGNQVLLWGDPDRPRELALGWQPPVPWYRKWWVWAVAGGTVAAVTGATVYLVTRDPPFEIGGTFGF